MERFMPKKPEKEVISMRISTGVLAQVDRMAAAVDISRNEFINQCIAFALAHMGEEEQPAAVLPGAGEGRRTGGRSGETL